MRVMVIIKANKDSESGKLPSAKLLADMMAFNEELAKNGIMLSGEGLQPSSSAKIVRFSGTQRTVLDGPFTETKEVVAGFWIWMVKSMAEAVELVKRIPCEEGDTETSDVEIRPVFETEDFGDNLTPETRAAETRVREEVARRQA